MPAVKFNFGMGNVGSWEGTPCCKINPRKYGRDEKLTGPGLRFRFLMICCLPARKRQFARKKRRGKDSVVAPPKEKGNRGKWWCGPSAVGL